VNEAIMAEALTGRIFNLTDLADRMRLDGAARICVLETPSSSAELLSGAGTNETQPGTTSETLYFVVAGEGLIEESDGVTVIVTAGDVVMVPAHVQHRFVQQSRKFRTWKINLAREIGEKPEKAAFRTHV
jgi:mannose-6-phosphate isomerase-like protein (cupin superfamily)